MGQYSFKTVLDTLYGEGSDPWTLTGSKGLARLVRLRKYENCPERLGEYWTTGFDFQPWMTACEEQACVKGSELEQRWANNIPALAKHSSFFQEQGDILVIEQDSLLMPTKDDLSQREGISDEQLKQLQAQTAFHAMLLSKMPHSLAVHSGSKSIHIYIKMADPENWPIRPPSLGAVDGLPQVCKDIIRKRNATKNRNEAQKAYRPWHVLMQGTFLSIGPYDTGVFEGAGQEKYTRTPLALRNGTNGAGIDSQAVQEVLSVGVAVRWEDFFRWMCDQLNEETRKWLLDPYREVKPLKKQTELPKMLSWNGRGGAKDMLVRHVEQGGGDFDDQALTKQWCSVVANLYPTQKQPVIHERPNIEQGSYGRIDASYLWWVSALAVNTLSIPLVAQHQTAPVPYGWFFTGNDWWWTASSGSEDRLREIWRSGNDGALEERLEKAKADLIVDTWMALDEADTRMSDWAETGYDGRSAPSFGIDKDNLVKIGINKPIAQTAEITDRISFFLSQLGKHALRMKAKTVPFPSTWLGFDGKIWREKVKEDIHRAACLAFEEYPVFSKDGSLKKITEKDWDQLSKDAYAFASYQTLSAEDKFASNPEATVFSNGTLYVTASEVDFREGYFDPNDYAYRMMDYPFDASMPTPVFDNFLRSSFEKEGHAQMLLQFMGYLYHPRNPYKKFMVIVGEKDTGKTTLQNLLADIAGGGTQVISPSLDSIMRDKYWSSELPTAQLISIDEKIDVQPRERKMLASALKQITGNAKVECRRMQQAPFGTEVDAKLLITANSLPEMFDDSDALWERILLIEPTIPSVKDDQLPEKLRAERAGIAAKAAEALRQLKAAKGFKRTTAMVNALAEYRTSNSPLFEFWQDWMVEAPDQKAYLPAVMAVFNSERRSEFGSENKFVAAIRTTWPTMKVSRLTREQITSNNVLHAPPSAQIKNSAYVLVGWECTHPKVEYIIAPTVIPMEHRGTALDHSPIPAPRIVK